jgi:hypothetical protein
MKTLFWPISSLIAQKYLRFLRQRGDKALNKSTSTEMFETKEQGS